MRSEHPAASEHFVADFSDDVDTETDTQHSTVSSGSATTTRSWLGYAVRRVAKSMVTLFLVVSAAFFLVRYMPGDPVQAAIAELMQTEGLSYSEAALRAASLVSYDPSAPLGLQYLQYLANLAHGDLGTSITSPGTPVSQLVTVSLGWTVFSVGTGTIIAFVLGIALGIWIAYRRGGIADHVVTNVSAFLHAVPNYVWALLTLIIFGVQLEIIDITALQGTHDPGTHPSFTLAFALNALKHAALPILLYVFTTVGGWILTMKASTLQVLDEDFVTVAHVRGLPRPRILVQYVGRNAILPLFTSFALAMGNVVGGSILIETIFSYNGVGYYLYDAIIHRDYPVMQGFILVMTIAVIVANLIADLLLSRIDPRIQVSGGSRAS